MKKADVVIGANLGDEGKGLITDYLAARYGTDAVVVRFCGGAQAGHTVTAPEGKRHVFSHFGSGSLCGSSSYLSRYFICNPILFLSEAKRLETLGVRPKVFVDPAAPVTTPYDMMINQMIESLRGQQRHGSCGMGVGETVERQQYAPYALYFSDLYNLPGLHAKLNSIRRQWVPSRLRKLGIETIPQEWKERMNSEGILTHFIEDVEAFLEHVRTATLSHLGQARHVIFEGAQGLLLDQDHEWFPHVTRAHTGLKNVVNLAKAAGLESLSAYYTTRCYATRHGAGPLPHELKELPYKQIVDQTNIPNPYQGALRFGYLDLDLLQKTISQDLKNASSLLHVTPHLALTCLDQIDNQAHFISEGVKRTSSVDYFIDTVASLVPSSTLLASYGPTRETVRKMRQAIRTKEQTMPAFLESLKEVSSLINSRVMSY